jgi:Mor family transcriptional regulator
MGYIKAEEILPPHIVKLIQDYIDGESIYIPRKEPNKKKWGSKTLIRQELQERNSLIFADYQRGERICKLSDIYFLSEKSIQRIIREMKRDD